MSETTAFACPEHLRCVVKLLTVEREASDSRPIVAPKWADEWMQSRPDRWLVEVTHVKGEDTSRGIAVPNLFPATFAEELAKGDEALVGVRGLLTELESRVAEVTSALELVDDRVLIHNHDDAVSAALVPETMAREKLADEVRTELEKLIGQMDDTRLHLESALAEQSQHIGRLDIGLAERVQEAKAIGAHITAMERDVIDRHSRLAMDLEKVERRGNETRHQVIDLMEKVVGLGDAFTVGLENLEKRVKFRRKPRP